MMLILIKKNQNYKRKFPTTTFLTAQLNNITIEEIQTVKLLAVTLDHNLKWDDHLNAFFKMINSLLYIYFKKYSRLPCS